MSALANTSVCPRCGAGFRCGMVRRAGPPQASTAPSGGSALHEVKSVGAETLAGDAECWCVKLPNVMPVPSLRTADNSAASCYCPACLKRITDAQHLTRTLPRIEPTANPALQARLRHKIDHKTKPLGALGALEGLALQLGLIQQQDTVTLREPQMVVFAADHGVAAEGVSAYPQAVTVQMVANMLAGGAAVNVFARQHGFALQVVDAGVAADLPAHPQLLARKIAHGTQNLCVGPAMTRDQAQAALAAGIAIVKGLPGNVVAFGEMGIANTSAAALLLVRLAGAGLEDATGRGTGLSDPQLAHKQAVLQRALARQPQPAQPLAALDVLEVLADVGGFEIAMMAGAMLQAASERRVVLVDGFIAGAAALVAHALVPQLHDYLVFCHRSAERGHRLLLDHLKARPLLELDLRLGEGTGALLAWPLLQSAAGFLNEMASFESAGVSGQTGA